NLAAEIDEFHQTGSKIMIIRDPFRNPTIVGSTEPIPMGFLEDLRIDGSGQKLYAYYRGAGNVVVLDIDKISQIQIDDEQNGQLPIEQLEGGANIYGEAIDVAKHGNGLAIQNIVAIDLIAPVAPVDLFNDEDAKLTFEWEVDV